MDITRDIHPISYLKRKTAQLLDQLEETGEPVILTHNGEPTAVIQNAAAYQELIDMRERLDTILSVRRGIDQMTAGQTRPLSDVLAEARKRSGHALVVDLTNKSGKCSGSRATPYQPA